MKRAIFGKFIFKGNGDFFSSGAIQASLILLLAILVVLPLAGCGKDDGTTWRASSTPPVATDINLITNEDTALVATLEAIDDDGDELTFTVTTDPANGTLTCDTEVTSSCTYTPNANYNGSDSFTFAANDGTEDSAEATVTITVNPVNDAPTISGTPTPTIDEDIAYSFTSGGGDVDLPYGDTLTYSVTGNPAWLSIDATSGVLTGTPLNGDVGATGDITITVTDDSGDTGNDSADLAAFTITVVNTNDAPTVATAIPDQEVNSASFPITVNLSLYFTEVDAGDSLTYSVTVNSDATTVSDSISGSTLTLAMGARNSGRVEITVTATDGASATATDTFAVKFPFLYSNGADWNDYVKNDGGDIFNATDTACAAAADGPGYDACIHGGEIRSFDSGDTTACGSLSAVDALAAFDWSCANSGAGGTAVFTSTGLAAGKNLSDLIDFATPAWKPNQLFVTGGAGYTSVPMEWWENPLVVDNNGMASGAVAGTIYLVTADPAAIYVIDASKVGLVVKPGVTLNGPDTSANLISVTGKNFTWSEGMLDVNGDDNGVLWTNVKFSVLRGVSADNGNLNGIIIGNSVNNKVSGITVTNNNSNGMVLQNSANNNTFSGISAANNTLNGVFINNSSNNTLSEISAVNNLNDGVKLLSSSNNTLSKISAANNLNDGINLNNFSDNNRLSEINSANNGSSGVALMAASNNNTLYGISAANNGSDGVHLSGSLNNTLSEISAASNFRNGINLNTAANNNTLSGISASNNGNDGVFLETSSSNNTFSGITAANNDQSGVTLIDNASDNTLSGISAANNGTWGVYLDGTSNNFFTGLLKVGGNGTGGCFVNLGTNPGLDGACANDPGGTPPSNAILTTGITLAASFWGKVTIDDVANASDTNGAASYPGNPALFDWASFDNIYSGWGIDGSAFPNVDHRGRFGCKNALYINRLTVQTMRVSGTARGASGTGAW